MRLKFIKNFKYLFIIKANEIELEQLANLTSGSTFNYQKKKDDVAIYLHNYSLIPAGFWAVILSLNKSGYDVEIENLSEFRDNIQKEDLEYWIEEQDLKFKPYEYQLKGVLIGINFRHLRLLLDTSAGKSYIIYLYSLYLLKEKLKKGKKILVIVPRTMLVKQLPKDFKDYSDSSEIICDEEMGNETIRENSNVVVGNINTLANKPRNWYNQFGAVILDEAHKISNISTQNVMNTLFQTGECDYVLSMSGTFETKDNGATEYSEYKAVTETAYLGSILQKLYVEDLKKYGSITPVKIKAFTFIGDYNLSNDYYNHPDCAEEGGRFLFESNYIQGIPKYRSTIIAVASSMEFNQVLLFNTKDFLKKMALECVTYLKKNNIDKKVYVITGDTKDKERDFILDNLNNRHDGILFAMYAILSTGVSVKSLNGIHLVDSTKSVIRVRQSIGRVLRLHPSKKFARVIDYSVYFNKFNFDEWGGGRRNSYNNHKIERLHIYEKRKFEVTSLKIPLNGRSSFMDEIPRCHREKVKK